jgi:Na+/H+ antiporter NhaC
MENFGLISILPPLITIALAMKTRHVVFSLVTGVFFGILALSNWNPILALASLIKDYIYIQAAEPSNVQSLTNLFIIGGFVALIEATGGATAFASKITNLVKSKRTAETATWIGGLAIWFSDSANALICGPIFRPLTDSFKTSREKLAYILDSTSTLDAAMIPIISWGVYIMGLIQKELDKFPQVTMTSWDIFVGAIPFQFYSILTLFMIGFVCISQFDYGSMLSAQKRAETGKLLRDGAVPLGSGDTKVLLREGVKPQAKTIVIPLVVMIIVTFTVFVANGFPKNSLPGVVIRQGIALGFILGAIVCVIICKNQKILTLKECERAAYSGMKNMMELVIMMILSWSLGSVCTALGTAYYIMSVTEGFLNPAFLPAIIFVIGTVMSFASGSSWGTFAVMMPIAFPMAITMGSPLLVTVAAIIGGGLVGDHVSPVSDTMILASMASGCDLMDHFKTQMPYAAAAAGVGLVLYLISGFYQNPYIVLLGIVVLYLIIYALHKISLSKISKSKTNFVNNTDSI